MSRPARTFVSRATGLVAAVAAICAPALAAAELEKLTSESDFVSLVAGKTITRPFVELQVSPQGEISGRGLYWDVEGEWSWQDGYFCRSLFWGGDDLGYNCQEVRGTGDRIRFISDRGDGQSAEFTLR